MKKTGFKISFIYTMVIVIVFSMCYVTQTSYASGTKDEPEEIELNSWYSGVTPSYDSINRDNSYDWYSFYTTDRSDSKYKFIIKATRAEIDSYSANINLVGGGYDDSVGYGYVNDSWDDIYSQTLKLDPGESYKLAVNGDYCGFFRENVAYDFMVKEVIAKPSKGKIKSLKSGQKKLTVKFSKLGKAKRYQIAYKKKGGRYKYLYTTKTSRIIRNLQAKKYYYVKVRGQRCIDGSWYSGAWSATKRVKIL